MFAANRGVATIVASVTPASGFAGQDVQGEAPIAVGDYPVLHQQTRASVAKVFVVPQHFAGLAAISDHSPPDFIFGAVAKSAARLQQEVVLGRIIEEGAKDAFIGAPKRFPSL